MPTDTRKANLTQYLQVSAENNYHCKCTEEDSRPKPAPRKGQEKVPDCTSP